MQTPALCADERPEPLGPVLRLQRPRLLVVEDDVATWRLIERAARAAQPDLAIHWASDADAARRELRQHAFDLVLADFLLEDSDNGWWILNESRLLQPRARVAMASSLPLRPPEIGACPFLAKPFGFPACRDFLAELLR